MAYVQLVTQREWDLYQSINFDHLDGNSVTILVSSDVMEEEYVMSDYSNFSWNRNG